METHRQAGRAAHTFLVEGYWPDVRVETLSDATTRLLESMARLRREGHLIEPVATTLVPSDEATYWIVDGPSAEIVALAYARAGVAVDRIVEAVELPDGARRRRASGTRCVPAQQASRRGP